MIAWIAPDAITLVALDATDGHTLWTQAIGVGTSIGAVRTLLQMSHFFVSQTQCAIERHVSRICSLWLCVTYLGGNATLWDLLERHGDTSRLWQV
jgi:hypothetical protein